MASKKYQIIVSAAGKGIKATTKSLSDGFTRGQKAMAAFNATARKGRRTADKLTSGIKGLVAAYAGWQSVTGAVRIIKEADEAAFNMAASVAAANREFAATGSLEDWEQTIGRLSDRLQIYSDTALKNAISRTVDMTKRLGLEKDQMEELIVRAGDLGAGKVSLEGAIERVSAAMRGEAESAEYLGLTLNENYIKAWYEANDVTGKAWAELDDVGKAQARYAVFLKQSDEMQGRAADSAKTLGGAWQLVQKEVINAVSNNEDAAGAMVELAESLRANADEIGDVISSLVTLGAKTGEFVLEWRNVILTLAGTVVVFSVLAKLVFFVKGLNAAFVVLRGIGVAAMFGKWAAVIGPILATTTGTVLAYLALAVAIGYIIKKYIEMRQAQKDAAAAAARAQKSIDDVKKKYGEFKDVKIPGDLTDLAQQDLDDLNKKLHAARAYWQVTLLELKRKSKEKTRLGTFTDEAREAQAEMRGVKERLAELNDAIDTIGNNHGLEKPGKAVEATKDHLKAFKESAQEAYQAAADEAQKYADKITALNQSIADRELSLADKIRELRRKNMEEAQATSDLRAQALEKEAAAQKAVNKFAATGSERQLELAKRFAKDAESAWTSYAGNGKEATSTAIEGLERVNEILNKADQIQIDTFSKMREDAESAMSMIEGMIQHINESAELNIPVSLPNLKDVQKDINDLLIDGHKYIYIHEVPAGSKTKAEPKSTGGRAGMAAGGRFPGNSKKDSIPVLARPGEGFVRNEALAVWDKKFGTGFFDAINNPWSRIGQSIISTLSGGFKARMPNPSVPVPRTAFAAGGRVAAPAGATDMGTLNITVGGGSYPVSAPTDVLTALKNSLTRENALRSNE